MALPFCSIQSRYLQQYDFPSFLFLNLILVFIQVGVYWSCGVFLFMVYGLFRLQCLVYFPDSDFRKSGHHSILFLQDLPLCWVIGSLELGLAKLFLVVKEIFHFCSIEKHC